MADYQFIHETAIFWTVSETGVGDIGAIGGHRHGGTRLSSGVCRPALALVERGLDLGDRGSQLALGSLAIGYG